MAIFRTQTDKELGEAVYGFFECRHLLFNEESNYVFCPACGEHLAKNLPQDKRSKAWFYITQKKLKNSWLVTTDAIMGRVAFALSLILSDPLSWLILGLGDYGFKLFIPPSNHYHGLAPITMLGYLPLYLLFLGSERHKRAVLFSFGLERWYAFCYFWPFRLLLFCLTLLWINSYAPPLFENIANYYMSKHDNLTQAQQERGVELFIFVNMLSVWILAGILAIFEGLNAIKTRLIKQANETYLAGLREENE